MSGVFNLGKAVLELTTDSRTLKKEFDQGKAHAQDFAKATTLIIAGAGVALFGLGAAATKMGSDWNEAVNKSAVIFGSFSGQVKDFAGTTADSLGISAQSALDAAGSFGSLFTTVGLGQQPAAEMSTRLVTLAADLASFNNIDPTEALEKLRSGLVGEAEPLRSVGILLNESAVQAKAYQMGIAKVGDELTEAQKVQARYAIILEQGAQAAGDFSNTATGMANAQRRITADFEDAGTAIGKKLYPLIGPLVAQFASDLPGALRTATNAISTAVNIIVNLSRAMHDNEGVAVIVQGVLIALGAVIVGLITPSIITMTASLAGAATAAFAAAAPFIAIGVVLGTVALAIKVVIDHWSLFEQAAGIAKQAMSMLVDFIWSRVAPAFEGLGQLVGAVAKWIADKLSWLVSMASPLLGAIGIDIDALQGNLQSVADGAGGAFEWAKGAVETAGQAIGGAADYVGGKIGELGGFFNDLTKDIGGSEDAAAQANKTLAGTPPPSTAKNAKEAKSAMDDLGASVDGLRKIAELLNFSQKETDMLILRMGGDILDTGEYVEELGMTFTRLSAIMTRAGYDGEAAVQRIKSALAAKQAEEDAKKAEQEAEKAARAAEEERKKAEEDAEKARAAVLAGIEAIAAMNLLGTVRDRVAESAGKSAEDFQMAIDTLEKLHQAGMDTSVAMDVLQARMADLAARFSTLTGDDKASAGAALDGIQQLFAAFQAGKINVEELVEGLNRFGKTLDDLSKVVDENTAKQKKAWEEEAQAFKNFQKAEEEALKKDAIAEHQEAIKIWSDKLKNETIAAKLAWEKMNDDMLASSRKQVEDLQRTWAPLIAMQNASLDSGTRARNATDKFRSAVSKKSSMDEILAALQEAQSSGGRQDDEFQKIFYGGISGIIEGLGIHIAPFIGESLISAIYRALGIAMPDSNIDSYDVGGWVKGPLNTPRLAVVHGGEYVVRAGEMGNADSGPSIYIETIYGFDDFERQVARAWTSTQLRGGFYGVGR